MAEILDPEELFRAIAAGEHDRAVSLLESAPSLIQARLLPHGWTPLHAADETIENVTLVDWLIERGADVNAKGRNWADQTPLDSAAHSGRTGARNSPMSRTDSCGRVRE